MAIASSYVTCAKAKDSDAVTTVASTSSLAAKASTAVVVANTAASYSPVSSSPFSLIASDIAIASFFALSASINASLAPEAPATASLYNTVCIANSILASPVATPTSLTTSV